MLLSWGRYRIQMYLENNRYRSTDVFFLGYPKTGNTWTRVLIGRYCQLFFGLDHLPLFDYYDRFGRCERVKEGPAMHFTHSPLEWTEQTWDDLRFDNVVEPFYMKKVVLITRHPLDSLVSSWYQAIYQTNEYKGELKNFMEDPVWGLKKCIRYYNLWADQRQKASNLMLLRYEDLRKDTITVLRSLLQFLKIDIDDRLMAEAIEFSSFENMRKMEKSKMPPKYKSSGLYIFGTGDKKNPNALHVREGRIGGYRGHLSAGAIEQYEKQIIEEMNPWYGYCQRS